MFRFYVGFLVGIGFAIGGAFIITEARPKPPCTTNYTGSGEESVTVCDGQTEEWVKKTMPSTKARGCSVDNGKVLCGTVMDVVEGDVGLGVRIPPTGSNCVSYPEKGGQHIICPNGIGGGIGIHVPALTDAGHDAPGVIPMDPAPDAPAFVKEMDKRWGESGRGERYAAYERRLAWGTASIGGKKAVWYAWSNTDAGVTTWFNVVIPKSGMKVCRAPLGTYEGEAGYDCSYSRLLQKGGGERKYAPDPKGMKWTSIFNSIRFVSGRQWLDVEANATDWEGEGKLAAAALAAQIQRDFPVVKNMQVRQLLR